MKLQKKILSLIIVLLIGVQLTGCQTAARNLGGTFELKLEENRKLVNITWKDGDLWYLTREMKPDESPETYEFKESNALVNVKEGKVIIIETRK